MSELKKRLAMDRAELFFPTKYEDAEFLQQMAIQAFVREVNRKVNHEAHKSPFPQRDAIEDTLKELGIEL